MIRMENEKKCFNKKCEKNKFAATDKNAFQLFCEISSIRGMHKITKAPTVFLKTLWVAFVFCMTTMLFLVTGLLIKDYLNYYTAWHVRTKFDDKSEFPAITLCSHNPFSIQANDLWKLPNAPSPYRFREKLKTMVIDSVNSTNVQDDLTLMMFHDKIENYYENIEYQYGVNVSHGMEMLKYCAIFSESSIVIMKNCETDTNVMVEKKIFSNHKYFNCFTIEKKRNFTDKTVKSIIILVSLTPATDIHELKYGFLMDILERGEGLRLVIHEPNSFPEIEEDGIDVQPGKMNNIKYEPVKWARHSTPVQKCENGQAPLVDLTRQFSYSFPFCMNYNLQLKLIETCGCMSALFPRPFIPNEKIGYCFNLTHENISLIAANIKCTQIFMESMSKLRKVWENTKCMQRCDYFTYNTELSITKWVPSHEKLFRIADLMNKTEVYSKNMTNPKNKKDYISYIQSNISDSFLEFGDKYDYFKNENKFTYISLSRKTKNTVIKDEELVLDLAILMSRIGGLCSLFIGLTVSFFIELIEFGYLIYWHQNYSTKYSKTFKQSNNNKRQICESNNSLYGVPALNTYEKDVEQNYEERVDFITKSEFSDDPILQRNPIWTYREDTENVTQSQIGSQKN